MVFLHFDIISNQPLIHLDEFQSKQVKYEFVSVVIRLPLIHNSEY